MRLWLEMRTTLAPEDAERYSGAFVEDGATSLDLLVNAGYNKEVRCSGVGHLWAGSMDPPAVYVCVAADADVNPDPPFLSFLELTGPRASGREEAARRHSARGDPGNRYTTRAWLLVHHAAATRSIAC